MNLSENGENYESQSDTQSPKLPKVKVNKKIKKVLKQYLVPVILTLFVASSVDSADLCIEDFRVKTPSPKDLLDDTPITELLGKLRRKF